MAVDSTSLLVGVGVYATYTLSFGLRRGVSIAARLIVPAGLILVSTVRFLGEPLGVVASSLLAALSGGLAVAVCLQYLHILLLVLDWWRVVRRRYGTRTGMLVGDVYRAGQLRHNAPRIAAGAATLAALNAWLVYASDVRVIVAIVSCQVVELLFALTNALMPVTLMYAGTRVHPGGLALAAQIRAVVSPLRMISWLDANAAMKDDKSPEAMRALPAPGVVVYGRMAERTVVDLRVPTLTLQRTMKLLLTSDVAPRTTIIVGDTVDTARLSDSLRASDLACPEIVFGRHAVEWAGRLRWRGR